MFPPLPLFTSINPFKWVLSSHGSILFRLAFLGIVSRASVKGDTNILFYSIYCFSQDLGTLVWFLVYHRILLLNLIPKTLDVILRFFFVVYECGNEKFC